MRWLQTEYILKGTYLGFLVFVALQEPTWGTIAWVTLCTLAGLAAALAAAAAWKVREGYRVRGKLVPFLLFLLLESPELIYAGVLFGTALGAYGVQRPGEDGLLSACVVGGAVLGLVFSLMRHVRQRRVRLGLSLALGAGLVAAALYWFGEVGAYERQRVLVNPTLFGAQLLLGLPIFYLLTFAGRVEESEVEVGAMCAALGLGIGMLTRGYPNYQSVTFIACIMLYFWYTTRVLRGLRVFKHALRGLSYARIGRHRQALLSFRRALEFDPQNALAREGFWSVHRAMDLTQLAQDPETLHLIDFDLCVQRASSLLLQSGPTSEQLAEAQRLLDMVLTQRPLMRPVVHYWRAVAYTHARQHEQAAEELRQVLDPTGYAADDPFRRGILLQAWQLGLLLHPELARRIGNPQMALIGRRMEAIAAVERQLAAHPDDQDVWTLKRLLYSDLTEAEYQAAAGSGAAAEFDHGYVQQLGQALIHDAGRWRRGTEYLRLAARGLPASGPSLFREIAQAHERAGDAAGALQAYQQARQAGRAVGPQNLSADERHVYFAVVKQLAESAQARGDLAAAIENWELYADYERSGLETLRTLADLHERRGDPLAALRVTEQALLYNGKDKDLLERKDRYTYSVMPDILQAHLEAVKPWFDVAYCLRKANALLNTKNADLDLIDWALHLAELARLLRPESLVAKTLVARARLRRSERDEAVALLEQVRTPKPEKFASTDDEDAWFLACRMLGELYLYELGRPDQAVPCFNDYRKSPKSGADTMYKLGQAYEQLGDPGKAAKCYEHVTAYDGHPLAYDARDALQRLQSS